MGLLLEWLLVNYSLQIETSIQHERNIISYELSVASAILLLVLAFPMVRNRLLPFFIKH